MAIKKSAYNPNLFTLSSGRTFDTSGSGGPSIQALGKMQEEEGYREARQAYDQNKFRNPIALPPLHPMWNFMPGYFGVLKGRENAAKQQGYNFNVDMDNWGNEKQMDVPTGRTYSPAAGEAAPGMRGRPSNAMAALQNAASNKRGFYAPDEIEQAGGIDALTDARRRALLRLMGR